MPGIISQLPVGKVVNNGIETASELTWSGWEPGKEYAKHIVLKNIKVKTQKIKYCVPKSRNFTTLYPQPILLSAGNTFSLPITFRPSERIPYEDSIKFTTSEGNFIVAIKAVLPQFDISLPDCVTVGICGIGDVIQSSFSITNRSELVTPFHVEVLEPFSVEPTDGVLQPFTSVPVSTTFRPKEATIYECNLVVNYGLDLASTARTRLMGSGKYAHLVVSGSTFNSLSSPEVLVNFGSLCVDQTVEKFIELSNLSPVNASFVIDQQLALPTETNQQSSVSCNQLEQRALNQVFQCKVKQGLVPASSILKIPIIFQAKTAGRTYVDYLNVQLEGCPSKTVVKCIASTRGPDVLLSQALINFHLAKFGETLTKPIDIMNNSDMDATFQFELDNSHSVFNIEPVVGTVGARSRKMLLVHFHPQDPINYYRRLVCLVHNQGAINLDLLGTCHREMKTPAVLQPIHIQRYELYVDRGLSLTAPETLNMMLAEGKLAIDGLGALYSSHLSDTITTERTEIITPLEDYVNDGHHSDVILTVQHISLDVSHVDFGRVVNVNNVAHRTVCLTNHTTGKLNAIWSTGADQVFSVSPQSADIPPLASSSFQITFRPPVVNQMFSAQLECYAQFKSLRDHCLTDDITHMPPWCVTLSTTGDTFQPKNEVFLPKFSLDPQQMSLSVVNIHDSAYKTFIFVNTGPTPILYNIKNEASSIFSIKPNSGLVPVGCHQILVIKFTAQDERKVYKQTFRMCINGMDKYTEDITVYGSAETPFVRLDNGGLLYFKPTCISTVSRRQYAVRNLSCLPVCFEWTIKHSDSGVLFVHPTSGVLQPNEIQYHEWCFKPTVEEKYLLKPVLVAWTPRQTGYKQHDGKRQHFTLRVIGEGATGSIKCEQTNVDVGPLIVGTICYRHLTLANDSTCGLHYKLHIQQTVSGPYGTESTDEQQLCDSDIVGIELDAVEGILAARSRCQVMLTIRPLRRVTYHWSISYSLHTSEGVISLESMATRQHLCDIVVTGVYPTFVVTDAHCYGSSIGISKKQLWNLFSIDSFNMFLDGDPLCPELTYKAPTKHSHQRRPPIYTRAIVDFNFSAAPVNSEPCVVQLQLENTGLVPCEWAFLVPSDQQLELEFWAETGEFDNVELHELKVMDNKLFSIEPTKGKLLPGKTGIVTLSYKHVMVGTDRLPVLLKLTQGREILLNFVGVTVEANRPYIHFPSTHHMFAPVAIGELRSPIQVYEMYNGGSVPVHYEFNLSPLAAVFQENYSHAVFECINPKGSIGPGQTAAIEWKFSPLETRTYMVDISINIENSEPAVITFSGVGFDKRLMGATLSTTTSPQAAGVPSVQNNLLPGQLCVLSSERLSLGSVPLLTSVRRVVTVTNMSSKHCVKYTWHVTNELHAQFLTVSPRTDTLRPKQSALCTVKFFALQQPMFYDIDLICETVNVTDYMEYEHRRQQWAMNQERQKVEFTITEHDLDADLRLHSAVEERPSSAKLESICRNVSPDSELSKYKTLPPIIKQSQSTDDIRLDRKAQRKCDESIWPEPQPPKPFLLHLGLMARTHDISEYRQLFSDLYPRFFIDRSLTESYDSQIGNVGDNTDDGPGVNKPLKSICCRRAEADVLAITLSNILRSLIDDSQFHAACHQVSTEQIPYFKQFSATNRSTLSPPRSCLSTPPPAPDVASPQNSVLAEKTSCTDSVVMLQVKPKSSVADNIPLPPVALSTTSSSVPSFRDPSTVQLTPSQELLVKLAETDLEERNFTAKQLIKKQPMFGNFAEACLENTLMNIIQEAFKQEFNITARPRLVALPPRPLTPKTEHQN